MKRKRFYRLVSNNLLLSILIFFGILTSLYIHPKLNYIDWRVIALLFNLMVVVAALHKYKVLDYIATRLLNSCNNERGVTLALVGLCLTSSMFITNDVALITFVPITLLMSSKARLNVSRLIVLETLAANLGSSFTPLGNPQNLFLYSHYHMHLPAFLSTMSIVLMLGIIFLGLLVRRVELIPFAFRLKLPRVEHKLRVAIFMVLFLLVLFSVSHLLDYRYATLVILAVTLIVAPNILKHIDYGLLVIFIAFFIVIGNLEHIPSIANHMHSLLNTPLSTYWSAVVLSQFISNVPASILLASFTNAKTAILWGVSSGAMGTLIASMASVISYRLYVRAYPSAKREYLRLFTRYCLLGLIIFCPILSLVLFFVGG